MKNKKSLIIFLSAGAIILGGISTSIFFIVKAVNNSKPTSSSKKPIPLNIESKRKYIPEKNIPWSNIGPGKELKPWTNIRLGRKIKNIIPA